MPESIRQKIREAVPRGAAHHNFKGGQWMARTGVGGQMRMFISIPDEARRALGLKRPVIARARWLWMQAHPGETLLSTDVIHHINGDAMDDRPENLQKIPSQREHANLHDKVGEINAGRHRLPDKPCEVCGESIRPWRRFCSVSCSSKGLSGDGNPNAGRSMPQEQRDAIAAKKRGRTLSPETRERMRQAHLARWAERKTTQG